MAKVAFRKIHVGALLGDQEAGESLTLPNGLSSGGSRNLTLTKLAHAQSIKGFAERSLILAGRRVLGLYHYTRRLNQQDIRHLLAVVSDEGTQASIYRSADDGLTWTKLRDFGLSSVGKLPDFAQLGHALAITNGVIEPLNYDGVTLATAGASRLAAPTVTSGVAGLLDGTYRWRVRPIMPDGTKLPASAASAPTTLSKKQATVTWAAFITAAGYEVYRTTGIGSTYFFEGTTTGPGGTSFLSIRDDLTLTQGALLPEHGDAPPNRARFVEVHKERAVYIGTEDDPRKVWLSDPGLPYSVHKEGNFFDMSDADSMGDVATGGTGNYNQMFVTWLERSVWTISGTGEVSGIRIDFQRRRSNARFGTVSHRTVARIPQGSVYLNHEGQPVVTSMDLLAYLTPIGDIRVFNGVDDAVISHGKQDTLLRITYAHRHKAYVIDDPQRSEATWVFPADGATECTLAVTWNYRYGTWYERSWGFGHAITIDTADTSQILVAGDRTTDGKLFTLWEGLSNNGSAINAQLTTKTFYGSDFRGTSLMEFTKRWRWVDLLLKASGPCQILVEWWPGEADDTNAPHGQRLLNIPGEALVTADGQPVLTADGEPILVPVLPAFLRCKIKTMYQYFHARGIRLRFSSPTPNVQWAIPGFSIAYQRLDGEKREFRR